MHVQARDWFTCKYERGAFYGKMHEVYEYYAREREGERERERARGTKSQNRLTTSYGTKLTNCTHFKKNKRSYQIYDVRRRNGIVALLVGKAPHTAVTTLLLP